MRIALTKSGGFKLAATLFFTMLVAGSVMTYLEGKNVQLTPLLMIVVGLLGCCTAIDAWPRSAEFVAAYSLLVGGYAMIAGVVLVVVGVIVAAITGGFLLVFFVGLIAFFGGAFMVAFAFAIASALQP